MPSKISIPIFRSDIFDLLRNLFQDVGQNILNVILAINRQKPNLILKFLKVLNDTHAATLAFTNYAPTEFSNTTRTRHDIARCRDEPPNLRTRLASVQNALTAQAVAVQAMDDDWAHQTATMVVELCGAVVGG